MTRARIQVYKIKFSHIDYPKVEFYYLKKQINVVSIVW